jgi:hypothetical protein
VQRTVLAHSTATASPHNIESKNFAIFRYRHGLFGVDRQKTGSFSRFSPESRRGVIANSAWLAFPTRQHLWQGSVPVEEA